MLQLRAISVVALGRVLPIEGSGAASCRRTTRKPLNAGWERGKLEGVGIMPDNKKRGYSRWNEDEEEALRQGVAKYGEGKWRKILADTALMKYLDGRTNIDLKVRLRENPHRARSQGAKHEARDSTHAVNLYKFTHFQSSGDVDVHLLARACMAKASIPEILK
eukprot:101838-Prorocentrum_minimum.AAC.1